MIFDNLRILTLVIIHIIKLKKIKLKIISHKWQNYRNNDPPLQACLINYLIIPHPNMNNHTHIDFSIGCIMFIELWSSPGWKHTNVLHFNVRESIFYSFKIFNTSLFQLICANDEMGLMSRMNSYIKTLCSNFMVKYLVFNLLWTFKVVQKHMSDQG
jgi:hypothetical protein